MLMVVLLLGYLKIDIVQQKKISVMLALVQKTISLNNASLLDILTKISEFLLCNLKTTTQGIDPQYSASPAKIKGNIAVKNY